MIYTVTVSYGKDGKRPFVTFPLRKQTLTGGSKWLDYADSPPGVRAAYDKLDLETLREKFAAAPYVKGKARKADPRNGTVLVKCDRHGTALNTAEELSITEPVDADSLRKELRRLQKLVKALDKAAV